MKNLCRLSEVTYSRIQLVSRNNYIDIIDYIGKGIIKLTKIINVPYTIKIGFNKIP